MSYRKPNILDQSALFGLVHLSGNAPVTVPYRIKRETCLRILSELAPIDAAFLVRNVEQIEKESGCADLFSDLIEHPHESLTREHVQAYGAEFYAELRKLRGTDKKPEQPKSNIIQFAPHLAAKRKQAAA